MNMCRPLFLKGNCHSIPFSQLETAFTAICEIITRKNINTIVWDGDPLTLVDVSAGKTEPVKSFTLLLPRIYEWCQGNGMNMQFVYGKKEKSVHNLLNNYENEHDKHGTYYGPFPFLSNDNTTIVYQANYDKELVNSYFLHKANMGIAFNKDIKWDMLGISLMKWFKDVGVNSADLIIVGMGDVVGKELDKLSNLSGEVPELHITKMEFERDTLP